MKQKMFLVGLCLALTGMTHAQTQTKGGGISPQMLQKMEKAQTPTNKALFNAMAQNNIDALSMNFQNQKPIDTYFNVETPKQSIHDQKSSGRCWMFSGFNVLRANFAKKHQDTLAVEFSHDYLFFYDQLEKANLMLQGVIDHAAKPLDDTRVQFFFHHPINDGGTFCGVADLAYKYGLVPKGVQPETYSAENTSRMARILSSKLREYGLELREMVNSKTTAKAVQNRKEEMLCDVYRMLSMTLGEPVKEFTYAHVNKNGKQVGEPKKYTPRQFYEETVGGPLNGTFIMVMNDPRRPFYETYEVEYDRHTYDGTNWKYLNLPMEDIANLAIASLKDGRKLYSSYDVGKQFDRKRGYMDTENYDYGSLFGTTFKMDKAQRIATFDSGSTHAMTLTAVDLDKDGKPVKWKVENSWGSSHGVAGCDIMTNRWFNEYMFRLVVDKQYVPAKTLEQFNKKPIMVMPEDPLFQEDF
ncbi:MAG: C1 family peptidase [Prevotella sp.]|nr:C1 family peptidase [Prevotella sp.]MBR6494284.1 C1 family peptidase [Prevotella sp.]